MFKNLSADNRINSDNSDIFFMYAVNDANKKKSITEIKVVEIEEISNSKLNLPSTSSEPSEYTKHNYHDLKPLTFTEQLRLICFHYVTWSNILRYFSIVFCVLWFLFNAYHLTRDYFELTSKLDFIPSNTSRPPAVSICTQCLLCNSSLKNTITFQDILENELVLAVLNENGIENVSNDNSVPQIDVNITCIYANDRIDENQSNYGDCLPFTDVIVSLQKSRKCWTYFSEIYPVSLVPKPKIVMEYEKQPTINFQISGQMLYDNNSFLEVAIHNSGQMPISLEAIAHRLERGKIIEIRFTKKEWKLRSKEEPKCAKYRDTASNINVLPEELDSNVFSWSNALETRNGTPVYRSSAECFLYCMWRKLVDKNHKINAIADLTLEITKRANFLKETEILSKNSGNQMDQLKINDDLNFYHKFKKYNNESDFLYKTSQQACHAVCPSNCELEQFPEILVQKYDYSNSKAAYVFIQWSAPTFDQISFQENICLTEALGEIGGIIHVALKISVVQILRYLVEIIATRQLSPLYSCCLLNWFYRKRSYE